MSVEMLTLNTTFDNRYVTEAVLFSLHHSTQLSSSIFLHLQGRDFIFSSTKIHANQIPCLLTWIYPEERLIGIIGWGYCSSLVYPKERHVAIIGWVYYCSCVYPEERPIAIIGSGYCSTWIYPEERPILIIGSDYCSTWIYLKSVPL